MLERIRIASPCTADWEQMIGDDRVRFCSHCNLNVYNLSALTQSEAEELIANREGRLCARIYRRTDGTVLTRDCPIGLRAVARKISRVAGAALSAMMSASFAAAQNPSSKTPAQPLVQITPVNQSEIVLAVVDQLGAVIPSAKIRLVRQSNNKYKIEGNRDGIGKYQVGAVPPGVYQLTIESIGFVTYNQDLVPVAPESGHTQDWFRSGHGGVYR